ncbi:hypothetical protein BWK49_01485 [Mycobacterium intracellulare subsp. chimaera]|nr:hypothetical protein BWK49_01485 [Mycobacterium intracellulare subsp. chimaera]
MKMPDQRPVFQGDHPSNLIGWPTFQPSRLAGISTVGNSATAGERHIGRISASESASTSSRDVRAPGRGQKAEPRVHPDRLGRRAARVSGNRLDSRRRQTSQVNTPAI